MKIFIKNATLEHGQKNLNIFIANGKITDISAKQPYLPPDVTVIDAQNMIILPSLVDPHIHGRDMKQSHKATITQISLQAYQGGITALGFMPNTDPPITNEENLQRYLEILSKNCRQDYKIWFGVNDINYRQCHLVIKKYSSIIAGFKFYLGETFGQINICREKNILKTCCLATNYNKVNVFHCEDPMQTSYRGHENRPLTAETDSILSLLQIAKQHPQGRYHIAHCTSSKAINLVFQAQKKGLHITAGITPHHLFLNHSLYLHYGSQFLCYPPLRPEEHCIYLQNSLQNPKLKICLESDHAPHTQTEKNQKNIPGISNIREFFPSLITLKEKKKLSRERTIYLSSKLAAKLLGIERPQIKEKEPANLIIVDPHQVSPFHKTPYTSGDNVFSNIFLFGKMKTLIHRGKIIKTN